MNVLYVHRTQGRGAEGAHILGMFEALQHSGHRVSMVCPPGCDPVEQERARTAFAGDDGGSPAPIGEDKIPPRRSPFRRAYSYLSDRAPQWFFEMLELGYNVPLLITLVWKCIRFRPDLVYERYALHTFACVLVCRTLGIPRVVEVNDSVVIERSRPLTFRALATLLERFNLRSAALTVTITERFRQLLEERHGLSRNSTLVLPNAVSSRRSQGPFPREELRKAWGLEGTVLGASGQFLPWHGIDALVSSLGPSAIERGLRFFFVGDGPARGDIEAVAERLGIRDRVRFTGMVAITEVPRFLACLDIAVLPGVASHASPMKLMEYMAHGLPLVAVDVPSVRALAGVEEAVLVPPGDTEALRRGVHDLLDHPDRARALGSAARRAVLSHHTWDVRAQELMAALRERGVRTATA